MRIMLDTNILISIIFFPSDITHQFTRKISFGHRIVLCDYVLEELRIVVVRKFSSRKNILEQFFKELPFELVHTPSDLDLNKFPSVRDIKDSPILATAILSNIDILVTGDNDLLVMDNETPKIMTMREFIENY
ncbi:MAG: putative toxin-antitoxin system toxin component, PIN family [Clostridiales bacterium]|nr:putative toxin-antitoxin system toxin component, PIN family [Clostridiales bacterium]